MPHHDRTPLAAYFLRRALVAYLSLSVAGLAAMGVVEYQRQRARVMDEIQGLATTFGPVLGHAIWDYQDTTVTAILHGIVQAPDVVEVRLPAQAGFAGRSEAAPERGAPSATVRVSAALSVPGESGATQRVGTLVIASSEAILWHRVGSGVATTATLMAGVLLLLALVVWHLVRRLLVDPLARLSSQLQKETHLTPGLARRLPRFDAREFAVLRLRFILLLRQVYRAQSDLRQSHAQLEARVVERTLYLSQVLHFNAEIIRNSPVPMGVYASSGDCVAANDAYARLAGATLEGVLAQNFLKDPAWRQSPMQAVCLTALATHQPQQGELRLRTSFGKEIWCEYRVLPTPLSGQDHLLLQFTDLTERRRLELELRQLAFQDALTQLPNRRVLLDRLDQAIRGSRRHGNRLAVIFIDLDRFKELNDTCGHDVGDKLLVIVAGRLQAMLRGGDTVARLGGDEFVVLSTELGHAVDEAHRNATRVADKIRAALAEPCIIDGVQHACSASVGFQVIDDDATDAEEALKQADAAMYEDKKARRAGATTALR